MDILNISDITLDINNLFGLREQAKAFVSLVGKFVHSNCICLLFLDSTGERLTVLSSKPALKNNPLAALTVNMQNPAVARLVQEGSAITPDNPAVSQILKDMFAQYVNDYDPLKIGIVLPLISSDRLVGVLLVERRDSGEYTPEEISTLNEVSVRLAPGLEKEYLRERLGEREKELSVLNRCNSIISSSLSIGDVFGSFISVLKEIIDIEWATIILLEKEELCLLAIYSEIGSNWKIGEKMPVKGTATEWVMTSKLPLVESDLKKDSLFVSDVYHLKQGIRSIICVPLIVVSERAIGSLIIGVSRPNAYSPKQVEFLHELALQISMPVENSLLYDEVLKKSRYDELTGLLNRRSMDEQIISEINRHSRYGGVFSLILLDLDSLKAINDKYGHLAGDGLLARTGKILKESIRSVDQAFRYGGDEFAILLPNTTVTAAVMVSERVRKQLAGKLVVDDMIVTASFGLANWPASGSEANDIVAAADSALYEAKHRGGNQSYVDDNIG